MSNTNGEWNLYTLKEHFEVVLTERDTALKAAFVASQTAIDKADLRLDEILQGFPQEYARKSDFENVRKEINTIKADHVQRREFDQLKETQAQGRGARIALAAVGGVVLALITVSLGAMYANQLSHSDVSQQIDREAPWVIDRPIIQEEIKGLEQQVLALKLQLSAHQTADRIRAAKGG